MDQNDFLQTLNSYKKILWPVLKKNINQIKDYPSFCKIDSKYRPILDFHFKMTTDYPERKGKYIRPTLVFLTAQAMGVKLDQIIPTAAAMQLSEDWILVHDDIEDQSEQRRGQPTLQRIYGDPLAINAGDALHNLTWYILSQNYKNLGTSLAQKITNEFFTMINRTILGQTIEIKRIEDNQYDLSQEDILLIAESKTCYYTISGPMRLGAILAGATQKQLNTIYKFGLALGKSFQIIDDLLDLTSDFDGQKKQFGNDIYESKRTVMLVHLLNNSNIQDKKKLLNILKKTRSQKNQKDIIWVISKMKQYGSLNYSRQLADQFSTEAKRIFDNELTFLNQQPFHSQIQSCINFITARNH